MGQRIGLGAIYNIIVAPVGSLQQQELFRLGIAWAFMSTVSGMYLQIACH